MMTICRGGHEHETPFTFARRLPEPFRTVLPMPSHMRWNAALPPAPSCKTQNARIRLKDEGVRLKDEGVRLKDEGVRLKDEGVRFRVRGLPETGGTAVTAACLLVG
jgi:hypothetical protein